MTRAAASLALLALLSVAVAGVAAGEPTEIVGVAPNPTERGDPGEWVEVSFPSPTDVSGWGISDGETVARLPNRTLSGRVRLTTDPAVVDRRLDATGGPLADGNGTDDAGADVTVVPLGGRLALANDGETIELQRPSGVVDAVTFEAAPEGQRYVRSADGWAWRRPGATDRPVVSAADVPATLFVLPDDPERPLAAIEGARERVRLAAYTFGSRRVAGALCRASRRGVDVAVLVEGEPVGGVSERSVRVLDWLVDCGVAVSALGGPGDRYGVHHPKYAVVDDRALVLTENWKPAGTGGRSSRGWGVVMASPRVATALAETFAADAGYADARPWSAVRPSIEPVEAPPANGTYPARLPSESVRVDRATVLVAPDNAEAELVSLIDGAERSIDVQQVSIGGRDDPLLAATVRAARRGVSVRVLLSSAWYVREDNRELADWLDRLARREGLPIEARLVRPRSRFEKTHVKGLVVDGESVAVGSLNWNRHATRENREVVVVLHDREAAAYYGRAFLADWRGGRWRLPVGVAVAALLAVGLSAVGLGRGVRFEPPPRPARSGPLVGPGGGRPE